MVATNRETDYAKILALHLLTASNPPASLAVCRHFIVLAYEPTDVYRPTHSLYFNNMPNDYTEANVIGIFRTLSAPLPAVVKFFPRRMGDMMKEDRKYAYYKLMRLICLQGRHNRVRRYRSRHRRPHFCKQQQSC